MATIHLKQQEGFEGKPMNFYSIIGIEDVAEDERGLLSIEVAEYQIVAGDISANPDDKLNEYIEGWRTQGHKIIRHPFSADENH